MINIDKEYITPTVETLDIALEGCFASSWDGGGIDDIPHRDWDNAF